MRQMQPVLWTKGLLLTPQHLQVQDRFLEDLLDFRLDSHAFRPRGFTHLQVDRESLAEGEFAITEAAGILPDGLLFDVPASDAAPPPKVLGDYWVPDRDTLDLYLAIPERRPGGHNVATDAGAGSHGTRYLAEAVLRRDENTGATEKPIQVARKNFRILADTETLDGYSVLPAARVRRLSTGEYQIDSSFVPPTLDIGASDRLMTIARRLLELLSAKSAALSGMRRERRKGLAHFGASDVANFWLLYTVNTHLPAVRHIFETRRGHPVVLYEELLSLAGALSTFSTRVRPTDLPTYDHGDLSGCFGRLDETIRELLETVVPANHVTLPLRHIEGSVYATALEKDRYLRAPEVFLAVGADMKEEELVPKVRERLKVSSKERLDHLVKQALSGLPLRHVADPPDTVPIKLDNHYFRLEKTGPEWDAVRQARNLAVYIPSGIVSPRLELVILLPPEE